MFFLHFWFVLLESGEGRIFLHKTIVPSLMDFGVVLEA